MNGRNAQDVSVVQFGFQGKPLVAEMFGDTVARVFGFAGNFCFDHRAGEVNMTVERASGFQVIAQGVENIFCVFVARWEILRIAFAETARHD